MENLDFYLGLNYKLEISKDEIENGYVAIYPELPGCITCSNTLDDIIKFAEDAKKEWIIACIEDNIDIPLPLSSEDFSGQFKLRLPKTLHKSLSEHSKKEGISMNQYCLYLLTKNDATYSK